MFSPFGTYFLFKNFVSVAVTLHKSVMIWQGKDMDEIEQYVVAIPYEPGTLHADSPLVGIGQSVGQIYTYHASCQNFAQIFHGRSRVNLCDKIKAVMFSV